MTEQELQASEERNKKARDIILLLNGLKKDNTQIANKCMFLIKHQDGGSRVFGSLKIEDAGSELRSFAYIKGFEELIKVALTEILNQEIERLEKALEGL